MDLTFSEITKNWYSRHNHHEYLFMIFMKLH